MSEGRVGDAVLAGEVLLDSDGLDELEHRLHTERAGHDGVEPEVAREEPVLGVHLLAAMTVAKTGGATGDHKVDGVKVLALVPAASELSALGGVGVELGATGTVGGNVVGEDLGGRHLGLNVPGLGAATVVETSLGDEDLRDEPAEGGGTLVEDYTINRELEAEAVDTHVSEHAVAGTLGEVVDGLAAEVNIRANHLGVGVKVAEENVLLLHGERGLEHRGEDTRGLEGDLHEDGVRHVAVVTRSLEEPGVDGAVELANHGSLGRVAVHVLPLDPLHVRNGDHTSHKSKVPCRAAAGVGVIELGELRAEAEADLAGHELSHVVPRERHLAGHVVVVVLVAGERGEGDGTGRVGRGRERGRGVASDLGHRVPGHLVRGKSIALEDVLRDGLNSRGAKVLVESEGLLGSDNGRARALLELEGNTLEVDDDLLVEVALAVLVEVGKVESLALLEVNVENVDIGDGVRVTSLVVAHLLDLHDVYELTLVRGDLATAADLVGVAVDGAEVEGTGLKVEAEPEHVHLEELAAAVRHEGSSHDLVSDEVARKVPVVALEDLLTNEKTKAVGATGVVNLGDAVNHEHLTGAEFVVDLVHAVLGAENLGPVLVHEGLHLSLVENGLVKTRGNGVRGDVLLLGLLAGEEISAGKDDTLAGGELLVGEETGTAVAHLDEETAVDVAVVLEEEHGDVTVETLGEAGHADVVLQGLALLGNTVEGEGGVEQTVDAVALVLEVNTHVGDEHEITLTTLDEHGPGAVTTLRELTVDGEVVLSDHAGTDAVVVDLGVHEGDAGDEEVLAGGETNATLVLVDLAEFGAEDLADVTLGELKELVIVENDVLAAGELLLGHLPAWFLVGLHASGHGCKLRLDNFSSSRSFFWTCLIIC
mmetsp:Transcript_2482/g.5688  ORF Transcript_2482/g.5688 Transcript_2482/m.5688 type:complete len:879 (-) Transcript_2482:281-2917(-)